MVDLQTAYYGSVEDKLHLAQTIFREQGTGLRSVPGVTSLLEKLSAAEQRLAQHMAITMDLGKLCSRCGTRKGGGCCSLFMAGETDTIQLLINMLGGIAVRQVRADGHECCYLGDRGCIFAYKPMFCLNYNCSAIIRMAEGEVRELESLTGSLLGLQYQLEQYLLEIL